MNIIEMVNDIAKNLMQFSEEIKESRGSLTDEQINGILIETKVDVLEECRKITNTIVDVINGGSQLSALKQEQIKILIEKSTKEESNIAEIEDALNSLLRLAEAADKDLNINFFRNLFIEMFELIIILIITIKPNQSKEFTQILQNLKY
jgi:hypothetical protein